MLRHVRRWDTKRDVTKRCEKEGQKGSEIKSAYRGISKEVKIKIGWESKVTQGLALDHPSQLITNSCQDLFSFLIQLFKLPVMSSHSEGIKSPSEGIQVMQDPADEESSTFMLFKCYVLCEVYMHAYVAMNIRWFSETQVNFVIFNCSIEWLLSRC